MFYLVGILHQNYKPDILANTWNMYHVHNLLTEDTKLPFKIY
jgi:hypothetical protein